MDKVAPLKSSFMLIAMLGFMITVVYTAYGRIDETWGFTFGFVFTIMFIASLISMTKAPLDAQIKMAEGLIKPTKSEKEALKKVKK